MKLVTHLIGTVAMATLAISGFAQNAAEHEQHHPEPASIVSPARATAPGTPMAQMDSQMKNMSEMHQKMMNASTPEERRQLMADHMRTMKDSMSMMQGMMATRSANKAASTQAMMQTQMDMMQMMMDRMDAQAPSK